MMIGAYAFMYYMYVTVDDDKSLALVAGARFGSTPSRDSSSVLLTFFCENGNRLCGISVKRANLCDFLGVKLHIPKFGFAHCRND
jgi:hypothetical protein